MGTKRSVLTDEKGLPLAVVLSGANTHDVKLLEETLDHIVVLRPEPDKEHPQNLCLDAGYTGSGEKVHSRGYTPHIRPRGEEKKELERNPDFRARRCVVGPKPCPNFDNGQSSVRQFSCWPGRASCARNRRW